MLWRQGPGCYHWKLCCQYFVKQSNVLRRLFRRMGVTCVETRFGTISVFLTYISPWQRRQRSLTRIALVLVVTFRRLEELAIRGEVRYTRELKNHSQL